MASSSKSTSIFGTSSAVKPNFLAAIPQPWPQAKVIEAMGQLESSRAHDDIPALLNLLDMLEVNVVATRELMATTSVVRSVMSLYAHREKEVVDRALRVVEKWYRQCGYLPAPPAASSSEARYSPPNSAVSIFRRRLDAVKHAEKDISWNPSMSREEFVAWFDERYNLAVAPIEKLTDDAEVQQNLNNFFSTYQRIVQDLVAIKLERKEGLLLMKVSEDFSNCLREQFTGKWDILVMASEAYLQIGSLKFAWADKKQKRHQLIRLVLENILEDFMLRMKYEVHLAVKDKLVAQANTKNSDTTAAEFLNLRRLIAEKDRVIAKYEAQEARICDTLDELHEKNQEVQVKDTFIKKLQEALKTNDILAVSREKDAEIKRLRHIIENLEKDKQRNSPQEMSKKLARLEDEKASLNKNIEGHLQKKRDFQNQIAILEKTMKKVPELENKVKELEVSVANKSQTINEQNQKLKQWKGKAPQHSQTIVLDIEEHARLTDEIYELQQELEKVNKARDEEREGYENKAKALKEEIERKKALPSGPVLVSNVNWKEWEKSKELEDLREQISVKQRELGVLIEQEIELTERLEKLQTAIAEHDAAAAKALERLQELEKQVAAAEPEDSKCVDCAAPEVAFPSLPVRKKKEEEEEGENFPALPPSNANRRDNQDGPAIKSLRVTQTNPTAGQPSKKGKGGGRSDSSGGPSGRGRGGGGRGNNPADLSALGRGKKKL